MKAIEHEFKVIASDDLPMGKKLTTSQCDCGVTKVAITGLLPQYTNSEMTEFYKYCPPCKKKKP